MQHGLPTYFFCLLCGLAAACTNDTTDPSATKPMAHGSDNDAPGSDAQSGNKNTEENNVGDADESDDDAVALSQINPETVFLNCNATNADGYKPPSVYRSASQPPGPRMRIISIYEPSNDPFGNWVVGNDGLPVLDENGHPMLAPPRQLDARVRLDDPGEQVLVLASYASTHWRIEVGDQSTLREVHILSFEKSDVSAPEGTEVTIHDRSRLVPGYAWNYFADWPQEATHHELPLCTHGDIQTQEWIYAEMLMGVDHDSSRFAELALERHDFLNDCYAAGLVAAAEQVTSFELAAFDSCYAADDIHITAAPKEHPSKDPGSGPTPAF